MGGKYGVHYVLLIFLLIVVGCTANTEEHANQTSDQVSYEEFEHFFKSFRKDFMPTNFIDISPNVLTIRTTSFPHNQLDSKLSDTLHEDVQLPLRYEHYYKSKASNLLVKVNFIYQPSNKETSFLTINTMSNWEDSNILSEYITMDIPLFEEYIISLESMLVIINFVDSSAVEGGNEREKQKLFLQESVDFYNDFEQRILLMTSSD